MVAEPVSLVDLLRPGLEANPDAPAVVSADTHWTWRELDDRTDRVAAGLLALGLAPGDRVASLMPTGKVDRALLVRMADPSAVA